MRHKFIALIPALAVAFSVAHATKPPAPTYQDAVLVSFRDVVTGEHCSTGSSTTGTVSDSGNINTDSNGSASCHNQSERRYTVSVDGHTYILERKPNVIAQHVPLGWAFVHDSVLANLIPGTPIKVRTDEHGFYVKVGSKESAYTVVAAQ